MSPYRHRWWWCWSCIHRKVAVLQALHSVSLLTFVDMSFVPLGGATPLIGVSAAAAASSLTLSWEVTVVAPTAAARRAAGLLYRWVSTSFRRSASIVGEHLARHSAVDGGFWYGMLP